MEAGKVTVEELRIDEGAGSAPVIGSFDAEFLLPQVVVADSFNRVFFRSAGYTIGLGARIAAVAARL